MAQMVTQLGMVHLEEVEVEEEEEMDSEVEMVMVEEVEMVVVAGLAAVSSGSGSLRGVGNTDNRRQKIWKKRGIV